ncbi:hypothetical protein CHS0354_016880 [Potamilus streckersoni]|uniref:BCL2-associated athanogene 6 n=1 Tax=Potamilus streckersoni TaxID=2493646 RepID=A0AAE0S8H4_9BIVA|nr:hypothetical protein CHS0354_016880 [Potamilus streckersoni]
MMDVSVKTLDGHNRSYSMPDNVTVKQFKEKIANSINIPVDKQRLIFQGRVLQDDKLLKDYDVNGKVIHVVQRAPPAASQSTSNGGSRGNVGTEPPSDRPRDASNVFIGSFTLPSDIIDPTQVQQIVQEAVTGLGDMGRNARVSTRTSTDGSVIDVQINLGQIPPDQIDSESRLRLNQARRMIRLANETVGRLENPSERRAEETGASSSRNSTVTSLNRTETSESVTENLSVSVDSPAEAQSISSGSPMDISETPGTNESQERQMDRIEENTPSIDLASNETVQESRTTEPEAQAGTTASSQTSENQAREGSSQSRAADIPQTESQESNGQGPQASNQQRGPLRPNISELGQVLQEVQELNRHIEPYLERFRRILMEDAELPENEVQEAQRICNMMAEVLHATSHGYHCLSDLMVDLGQRPPRQLYAALALPTSAAVIQQTIPVQAQISVPVNMSAAAATLQARFASQATTTTTSTTSTSSPATPSQPSQAASTFATSNSTSSVTSVHTAGSGASEREGRIPVSMPLSTSGSTTSSNPYVFLEVGPEHITVNSISAHVVTTTERRMESDNDNDEATVAAGTLVPDTNAGNTSTTATTTTSTTETPVPPELIPQLLQSIAESAGLPPQDGQHQPVQMNFLPFQLGSSGMSSRPIDISSSSNRTILLTPDDFTLSADRRRTTELRQNNLAFSEDTHRGSERSPDNVQTNSSATQTRPPSVNSSGVQTRTNPISNSGTQTPVGQHRAEAFVMPGFPGLPGMMPRGIRPVDPYLPCMSRHFLTQQARNLANELQPQTGETALADMVGNLMLGLLGQTNPHTHGHPAGSSSTSATPTEPPGSTSGRVVFPQPGFLPRGMAMPPGMRNPMFIPGIPGFRVGIQRTPAAGRGQWSTRQSTQNPQEPQFVNDLRTLLQHAGQAAVATIQESQNSRATTTTATASTGGSSNNSTTATTSTTTQSSTSHPGTARSLSDEAFTQLVLGISTVMSQAALGAAPQVNMADFLSSLGDSYNVPHGEGFINDLMNCVLTHLQITDLLQVFNGIPAPLNRVHVPLQNFVREEVLQKAEVNAINIQTHVKMLIERMQDEIRETVAQAEVRPNIDFYATLNGFLTHHLITLMNLIMNTQSGDQAFGTNLYNTVHRFFTELVKLCECCLVRGLPGFQTLLCNRIQNLSQGVNPMIQQWMVSMTVQQLASFLPSITITEDQVRHYILPCTSNGKPAESETSASEGTVESVLDASSSVPMETELTMVSPGAIELNIEAKEAKPSTDSPVTKPSEGRNGEIGAIREAASPVSQASANEGPQEAVNGMEDWMTVVPEDWVPVITRDIQRQRQQRPQNPHSDAYLQGIPPKRRRLMTQDRPDNLGSASEILPDSIRRAVAAAGVEPISSMENLTNEAAEDTELQNAFEEEVCSVVRDRLQDEPDYVPERFPNANDFCKKAKSSKKCSETCL